MSQRQSALDAHTQHACICGRQSCLENLQGKSRRSDAACDFDERAVSILFSGFWFNANLMDWMSSAVRWDVTHGDSKADMHDHLVV